LAITQESFDALLDWLVPGDREGAGQQYEIIYAGLVRIFTSHGFSDAEHLADKTVDRVARRLPDIRDSYTGPKVKYFVGVTRNIIREEYRNREIATDVPPEPPAPPPKPTEELDCLRLCLKLLTPEKRELTLDYHAYKGSDKVKTRAEMARELGITDNALRGRIHHIMVSLRNCTKNCRKRLEQKQKMRGKS